jgi:hypothetical protein
MMKRLLMWPYEMALLVVAAILLLLMEVLA